jgi:RNA polymerase sigma factor (TIGR02999 family)
MNDVTQILAAIERGEARADDLLPLVYQELRRLAKQKLAREKPGQTLDATGLVHEAYLRMVAADRQKDWDSRGHFLAAAAEAMRRILVENARHKRSQKRGGHLDRQELQESQVVAPEPADELLALDEALTRLAERDPEAARLIQLRYFAGLTSAEAAHALGIAERTADRLWAYGRAWLRRALAGE